MVSEPRFPEMNSSSRKDIGANQDTLWKARCTKVSPYPDALNRLMPRHGLLGVVGQINPLEGHSDPIGDVRFQCRQAAIRNAAPSKMPRIPPVIDAPPS
jgi:hypothetical protein